MFGGKNEFEWITIGTENIPKNCQYYFKTVYARFALIVIFRAKVYGAPISLTLAQKLLLVRNECMPFASKLKSII